MSHPRRRAPGRLRHTVRDKDGLADFIRQAVRNRYGDSQRHAARELVGPRASPNQYEAVRRLIGRLAQRKMDSITEHTLQLIGRLVGPEGHKLLLGPEGRHLLLAPSERLRVAAHQRWVEHALSLMPRTQHLEERLRSEHPDLFPRFDRFLERFGYVEVAQSGGRRRGSRQTPRAELAFREVLAPLTRDRVTGQIERGASELSPPEMCSYLRHALAAQRILLRRPAHIARARSAAAGAEADEAERRRRQPAPQGRPAPPPRLGWRVTGGPRPPDLD